MLTLGCWELVDKMPWKNAFEPIVVCQHWSLFKYWCQKLSRQSSTLTWLSKLLLELRWKKNVYGHWKQDQATWEDWRNTGPCCIEKICVAKAQLEWMLASSKKGFFKYVNCKGKTRDSIGPLLAEIVPAYEVTTHKAETFNTFFACLQHWQWTL